jgi:hypothetical protein
MQDGAIYLFIYLFFIFLLLFIGAYKAWFISPPCPHPLPCFFFNSNASVGFDVL